MCTSSLQNDSRDHHQSLSPYLCLFIQKSSILSMVIMTRSHSKSTIVHYCHLWFAVVFWWKSQWPHSHIIWTEVLLRGFLVLSSGHIAFLFQLHLCWSDLQLVLIAFDPWYNLWHPQWCSKTCCGDTVLLSFGLSHSLHTEVNISCDDLICSNQTVWVCVSLCAQLTVAMLSGDQTWTVVKQEFC